MSIAADQPALLGGPKTKTKPFPKWPIHDDGERQAVLDVLESKVWWRTPGTQTLAFEKEFAAFQHCKHGIAITNGTHALEVALLAMGVSPGHEVIVPNYTFVATASSVLCCGAMPVMVDIEKDSQNIDPDLVEEAITPRTKAIIAVHMGGQPAQVERLQQIACKHGLDLLEDCAHAHGSEWKGRRVGSFGVAGTFSFQQSKLMTAGEGGCIVTPYDHFERQARSVHDCGRLPGEWFYAHFQYGSNYRLSEFLGAILRVQLARAEEQTLRRHQNGRLLDRLFAEVEGITPQVIPPEVTRNSQYAYIFHVDLSKFGGISIRKFIEAMNAEGIPNQAAYPPIHALDAFQNGSYRAKLSGEQAKEPHRFLRQVFPNTLRAAWESFWVPQYCLLGDEQDMHEIVAAVKKVQATSKQLA
jgi:dTDP-4-amino-4,6-dideoxygalactose transaminase